MRELISNYGSNSLRAALTKRVDPALALELDAVRSAIVQYFFRWIV